MDEETPKDNEEEFTIILLGDPDVGKESIIHQFVGDEFNPEQHSTLGISYSFKDLKINDRTIKLKLINIGGQGKYSSLPIPYCKKADVVLFVFDLHLEISFESVQYWVDLFNKNNDGKKLKLKYLIGNNNDLEQYVGQALIDEFVKRNGLLYLSTSPKTKSQIDEMFEYIAGELYEYTKKKIKSEGNSQKGKVLTKSKFKKKKNQNCHG